MHLHPSFTNLRTIHRGRHFGTYIDYNSETNSLTSAESKWCEELSDFEICMYVCIADVDQ
jgi:hypothetical protein